MLLRGRLSAAIATLNPGIPAGARDDALAQVLDLGTPALLSANELKAAMREYTASQGRGRPTVDAHEAYAVLAEKLDVLRACCTATTGAAS